MFCDEVLEAIESIASGDLAPDARISAHLASCANCRAALDHAREIERLLHERSAPAAPAHFTSRMLARIRRDRWRRDQILDAGFNTAVAVRRGHFHLRRRPRCLVVGGKGSDAVNCRLLIVDC